MALVGINNTYYTGAIMDKFQEAIKEDFIDNDAKHTFHGWPQSMIVGYYQQFFYDKLSLAQIDEAIEEACKQLRSKSN